LILCEKSLTSTLLVFPHLLPFCQELEKNSVDQMQQVSLLFRQ